MHYRHKEKKKRLTEKRGGSQRLFIKRGSGLCPSGTIPTTESFSTLIPNISFPPLLHLSFSLCLACSVTVKCSWVHFDCNVQDASKLLLSVLCLLISVALCGTNAKILHVVVLNNMEFYIQVFRPAWSAT